MTVEKSSPGDDDTEGNESGWIMFELFNGDGEPSMRI